MAATALDELADEARAGMHALGVLLEPSAYQARISCRFQDGAVVPPVSLLEFRIPPSRINELLDRRDFQLPPDLYPVLARVARLLRIDTGDTALTIEYDQERNVRWIDRHRNVA